MTNQNQAAFQDLRVIQERLATDYIDFFKELRDRHSSESPVHQQAQNALNRTQEVIRLIGRMLGAGGTAPTVKELNQFQAEMDSLIQLRSDLIVSSAVERTKPQPIAPTNRIIQAAAQQYANRQQQHATAGRHSLSNATESWRRDALGVTKAVTEAMATPLLGPFARMGIEAGEWTASRLWRGTKTVVGGAFRGARGLYRRSADDREEHDNLHSFDADGARGMYDGTSIRQGLYQFFDEDAFKAKWTRQLLKSSGGDEESKSSGKGLLDGGLFKWLGLGSIAAVGAGVALKTFFPEEYDKVKSSLGKVGNILDTVVDTVSDPQVGTLVALGALGTVILGGVGSIGLVAALGKVALVAGALWVAHELLLGEINKITEQTKRTEQLSRSAIDKWEEAGGNPAVAAKLRNESLMREKFPESPYDVLKEKGFFSNYGKSAYDMYVRKPLGWLGTQLGIKSSQETSIIDKLREPRASSQPGLKVVQEDGTIINTGTGLQVDFDVSEINKSRENETKSQYNEETISLLTKISEGIAKIGTGSGIGIDARGPINAGASSELSFINRSSTPWNDSLYNVGSA